MKNTVVNNFLVNRDETGREVYFFPETGKKYFAEYIEPRKRADQINWGDVDPATKTVTGSYGQRYTGAVSSSDSVITKENGFVNIVEGEGGSVAWKINQMHEEWKRKNFS